jgi:hypothetical protein
VGCAAEFTTFARPDTAFLLYAAGRVLDGARLYVDVVEINPPLIVALNLPAVALARGLGIADITAFRLLTVAALLVLFGFSAWALRVALGPERRVARRLDLLLAFGLFVTPGDDFGQREHLLVALLLPFLLLAAARVDGRSVGRTSALAAGALAGLGIALKPHFLLLWAAVEGYAAWRTRARRPSSESVVALGTLLAYAALMLLATPEYFRLVALLGPTYDSFGRYDFVQVLGSAPGGPTCLLAALAGLALWRQARHRSLLGITLVALGAAYLAGAAQHKGWTYHFLPARVLAMLLLGLLLADLRRPLGRPVQRVYAAVAVAVLATTVGWSLLLATSRATGLDATRRRQQAQLDRELAAVRRHVAPGSSIYAFSYTINTGFPLVNAGGFRWASRFPHLWLLEALYHDQLHAAPPLRFRPRSEMGRAERFLNDAVAEDLARNQPELLMVLRNARDVPENAIRRVDYVAYFGRDPRIAAELASYRLVEDYGPYQLYLRAGSAGRPGVSPTADVGRLDVRPSSRRGGSDPGFFFRLGLFLTIALVVYARETRQV